MNLGVWIKYRRRTLRLTQEQLAEKAGVSLNAIKGWELGKRSPTGKFKELLAHGLNCTVEELYTDPSKKPKSNPVPEEQMDEFKKAMSGAVLSAIKENSQIHDPVLADLIDRFSRLNPNSRKVVSRLIDSYLADAANQAVQDKKRRA